MRIGIIGESLYGWGGGIDLLLDLGKALDYAKTVQGENVELYLLLPYKNIISCYLSDISIWLHEKCKKKIKLTSYIQHKNQLKKVLNNYKQFCPAFQIVYYKSIHFWRIDNKNKSLNKKLLSYHIDACFPAVFYDNDKLDVPYMTYVPDFQHKYMPDFFSEEECRWLSDQIEKHVMQSPHILVTSQDAKNDIAKFYPKHKSQIYCMPFCPICVDKWTADKIADVEKYNLPKDYFIISNQFWQHKSHITAFEALEILYNQGYKDIHIVCTGIMTDYRNKSYVRQLIDQVNTLTCKNNIHFLGYIPKNDQIQILKGAIGLIQMTLYEGNPGGNSVLDAISVGIPCIVSDIEINREITGYPEEEVCFFKTECSEQLAEKMIYIMQNGKKITDSSRLLKRMNENKAILAQSLLEKIGQMIYNTESTGKSK